MCSSDLCSDKPDTTQKKGEQMVRPYTAYRTLSACYLKPVKIMKIMDKTSALLLMFAEALEVFLA